MIDAGSITTAEISTFDPDALGPAGRAAWEQLGRRLDLLDEFNRLHPTWLRFSWVPLVGPAFFRARHKYVMGMEP